MGTRNLRFKINAALFATCGIIVLLFGTLLSPFELNRRQARFEEIRVLLNTVFQQKREELANEIFAEQRLALQRTLEDMQEIKGIAILSVYDLEGSLLLSTDRSLVQPLPEALRTRLDAEASFEKRGLEGRSFAEYASVIQVIGEKVGYLRMHYDLSDMERETRLTLFFFGGLLLFTLVIVTLFLNLLLSRFVTRPASRLRDGIRKVREGRLGEQVSLVSRDEIGEIANDFNQMSVKLQEQRIALTEAIQAKDAYALRLEESNWELEKLNTRLEDIVQARTAELLKSNRQLQQEINERKQTEQENRALEERLARSQKMEALGLLAGGVAHDLNNVLSGIVSYPDLLLMDLPEESTFRRPIQTIQDSGQKAAAIVQDLLTLARRGVTHTEVLNLNDVVRSYVASPEYRRLSSYHPNVEIEVSLSEGLFNMQGSPLHLRKTLMNLVSNAAEAQPEGGRVFVYTENRYVDRPIRGYDHVCEGEYVVLGVEDQGGGICQEDRERIFEPFYTKKVMGRSGTGLGMAVVWGTVQDHDGYIDIMSSEDAGTTFELYFSMTRERLADRGSVVPVEDYMGHGEAVLVVDDVQEQREIASGILHRLNYRVNAVSSGEEAVAYLQKHSVDLIVLDMIMDSGMDGLDTYRVVSGLWKGMKAVIASGFAESERVKEAQRMGAGEYVKKPYTLESIGMAVRRTLVGG